ncbi:MAG: hypothetical protein NTY64_10960 [Deltaproteobacteria bacterium]|nr:hypothetical protein [Deltaproteobacteria bacterium]
MPKNNRFGILAFFLILFVLLLAYLNYDIWSHPSPRVSQKEKTKKVEMKPKVEPPAPVAIPRETSGSEAIQVISEKNLFNPDRKEFSVQAAGGEQAKPVARPQVVLYGIVIAEGNEMATVVNPGRPLRKGEREAMTVKVGDRIGDYKLAKVLPDRIVLEASGDSFEIPKHRRSGRRFGPLPSRQRQPPLCQRPEESRIPFPEDLPSLGVSPPRPSRFLAVRCPQLRYPGPYTRARSFRRPRHGQPGRPR